MLRFALDEELLLALAEVPVEALLLLGVAEALEEELREELAADLFCEELAEVVEVLRLA